MKKSVIIAGSTASIKATLQELFNITDPIFKALEDGKISIPELFLIAPKLVGIPSLVEAAKGALVEFKSLTAAESQDIAKFFEEKFDIANDQLEAQIEEGIYLLADSYQTVTDGIDLYKRWDKWAASFKAA